MIYLLDVNVLIALADTNHPHWPAALEFFQKSPAREGWATCPLTQNAFLRILGSKLYPGGPGSPQAARLLLERMTAAPGHQFWPDDISLQDARTFPVLPQSKELTDFYLLGLAVKREARFATFDSGINPTLIPGGAAAFQLIPTKPA